MWNISTAVGDISIYLPHSQSSFKHSGPFIPPSVKPSLLSIYKTCKFRENPMKKPSPAGNSPTFHRFISLQQQFPNYSPHPASDLMIWSTEWYQICPVFKSERVQDNLWKRCGLGMGLRALHSCSPTRAVPLSVLINGSKGLTREHNAAFHLRKMFSRELRDVPPPNLAATRMPVHPGWTANGNVLMEHTDRESQQQWFDLAHSEHKNL